jgi:hypothetical protein
LDAGGRGAFQPAKHRFHQRRRWRTDPPKRAAKHFHFDRRAGPKIQDRLDRRYPEKVVVPIGTRAYAELRSPLDLTLARVAGSRDSKQLALPGFANNPIDPNGRVERTANYGTSPITSSTPSASSAAAAQAAAAQAAMNAAQSSTAQEAQTYANALNQLQSMENQLNTKPSSATSAAPSAPINWPQGDIQ